MPGFIRKLPFLDRFLHKAVPVGYNHIPYNWLFADATARGLAGNYSTADIGKLARQLSDNSLWMLTATTPTWSQVGSSGSGGASGNSAGTYAARPSAATAGSGWVYYATDVQEAYRSDGASWTVVPSGGTELGYAEISAPQTASSLTFVDVTGLSITTVVGERPIEIQSGGHFKNNGGANHPLSIGLFANGTQYKGDQVFWSDSANYQTFLTQNVRVSGITPGTTVICKVQFKQTSGFGTPEIYGDANWRSWIRVKTA